MFYPKHKVRLGIRLVQHKAGLGKNVKCVQRSRLEDVEHRDSAWICKVSTKKKTKGYDTPVR